MAFQLIPIVTVVRILGPRAVIAAKAIHKNMVAKAKREGRKISSQEEYLSYLARLKSKKPVKGPTAPKYDPLAKKAGPKSMDQAAKQVEDAAKLAAKEKAISKLSIRELRAINARNIRRAKQQALKGKNKK